MADIISDLFGGHKRKPGINGKKKGNANERTVTKVLKLWTGADFVRTPQSGALRWNDSDKIASDVICDTKGFDFPFVIETKALKSLKFSPVLRQGSGVFKIWEQVMFDAVRAQKLPIALLRPDGMETFKVGRAKFQNYYLVMLRRFGGHIISKAGVPTQFIGVCAYRRFDLIGFYLEDIIYKLPYPEFLQAIHEANRVEYFNNQASSMYSWSH